MSIGMMLLLPALVVLLLSMPLVPVIRGVYSGKRARRMVLCNLCAFAGVALLAIFFPIGGLVASAATEGVAAAVSDGSGLKYIAAALATGLSSIGAGYAVASAAPAAIGATSEDPKSFGKSLIFVALGEGVAIYGLLISILILQ